MTSKRGGLDGFAQAHGLTIGARYRRFIESEEAAKYTGCSVAGLPYWSLDSKVGVRFLRPTVEPFEENDVPRDPPGLVALAQLRGEAEFLAVDAASPEAPVYYWDHETGEMTRLAASLDGFLAGLLRRGDKTPHQRLVASLKAARAALARKQHTEILAALEPLPEIWATGTLSGDAAESVGSYFNYQGLALKGLGKLAAAKQAFARALELHCLAAILNLMALHLADGELDATIALGKDAVFFEDEEVFWVMRYLVEAYLGKGMVADAERELRALQEKYAVEDEVRVVEVRAWLEELAGGKQGTASTAAGGFLAWFGPLRADEDSRRTLRQWWTEMPRHGAFWQPLFRAEVNVKKEPTDDQLARMAAVTHLRVEQEGQPVDVTPLARLARLEHVSLKGDVLSLEPLRTLRPNLSVWVNNEVIRGLRMPSRADLALLRACEHGDAKAITAALDDGADPNVKTPQVQSALHRVMGRHTLTWALRGKLAMLLIERGADLYVDNSFGYTPIDRALPKVAKALEKAYQATGRQPVTQPFRVWSAGEDGDGDDELCTLGQLEGKGAVTEALATGRLAVTIESKSSRLGDLHRIFNYERLGVVVVSPRVRAFLEANRLAEGLSFLPIEIKDRAKKRLSTGHVVMHPSILDCLDEEKCQPSYRASWVTASSPADDSDFSEVRRLVLDEKRLPGDVHIFRALHYAGPLLVRAEAAELIAAQKFVGSGFRLLRR